MPETATPTRTPLDERHAPPDEALARAIVRDAIKAYCDERRALVPTFIDRNYSLLGALALHRHALGWDIVRAPANLTLSLPHLSARIASAGARRIGMQGVSTWLDNRRFFLPTDVAREIEWRLFSELLVLPYAQGGRENTRDALAETISQDVRIGEAVHAAGASDVRREDFDAWLRNSIDTYKGTRVSAADLANGLLTAGAGAVAFHKVTPGMLSLGPVAAQAIVQHAAIASFPLGAGAGGVWYGLFPAAAPAAVTVGLTGGLIAASAVLTAFSGVVTDPVQRRLGIHRRRLNKLVDCLEQALLGEEESRFTVRDHYVARVLDLLEGLSLAWRVAT